MGGRREDRRKDVERITKKQRHVEGRESEGKGNRERERKTGDLPKTEQ